MPRGGIVATFWACGHHSGARRPCHPVLHGGRFSGTPRAPRCREDQEPGLPPSRPCSAQSLLGLGPALKRVLARRVRQIRWQPSLLALGSRFTMPERSPEAAGRLGEGWPQTRRMGGRGVILTTHPARPWGPKVLREGDPQTGRRSNSEGGLGCMLRAWPKRGLDQCDANPRIRHAWGSRRVAPGNPLKAISQSDVGDSVRARRLHAPAMARQENERDSCLQTPKILIHRTGPGCFCPAGRQGKHCRRLAAFFTGNPLRCPQGHRS